MSRVLPKDCDHPEESLGPLPYRAGRPPRADEWECGVCGMWNVAKEPEYKRRFVGDDVEARPKARPYTHTLPCADRQGRSPMHVASLPDHPSHMGCSCACHHGGHYYDSAMWTWPTPRPSPSVRGTGYLPNPAPAEISVVNRLVAEGKLRSMDVSMDAPTVNVTSVSDFISKFIRSEPPAVVITASRVLPEAAVEVMAVMYDLVRGRGTRLVWEMSREMIYVLRQRATPPHWYLPAPPAPAPPVMFGGEIRAVDGVSRNDITLRVR